MPTDGLLIVRGEHGTTVHLGDDLVGNNDSDSKLICQALKVP